MDKSKFLERPGDSEGFTDALLAHALPWCPRCGGRHDDDCENPRGWQEVDGVKLPAIKWAERVEGARLDQAVRALTDSVLEETFQAWLKASTLPSNAEQYRQQLRRRIALMIARGMATSERATAQTIDLAGLV